MGRQHYVPPRDFATPGDARTEAKLANARAKALRPWYKKKRYWFSLVLLVVAAVIVAVVVSAGKAVNDLSTKQHSVVYSLTGTGTADVDYQTVTNGNAGSSQDSNVSLPWTKTITGSGLLAIFDVDGTLTSNGSLTCTLTIDGKKISTNTATGDGASADCSGSNP